MKRLVVHRLTDKSVSVVDEAAGDLILLVTAPAGGLTEPVVKKFVDPLLGLATATAKSPSAGKEPG